jgi:hypothetical protein
LYSVGIISDEFSTLFSLKSGSSGGLSKWVYFWDAGEVERFSRFAFHPNGA